MSDEEPKIGDFIYICHEWWPNEPDLLQGIFDVSWGSYIRPPYEPNDGPTRQQLEKVAAAGGTIMHEFRVPMARVLLSPSAVPSLQAQWVRGISDTTLFVVDVVIRYDHPAGDRDVRFIASLGGSIQQIAPRDRSYVYASVPDASIPRLRDQNDVIYVEIEGVDCPASRIEPGTQ